MDFTKILIEIATLFIVMLTGFVCGKSGVITAQAEEVLGVVTMKVAFPALIITSMVRTFSVELFKNSISLIFLSIMIYAIVIISLEWWRKKSKRETVELATLQFLVLFGNVTFLGFPVVNVVFGDVGVFYAASFTLLNNFLQFSYGVMMWRRDSKLAVWKMLMNPGFIATVVGFALFLLRVELPYLMAQPLTMIGNLTIPLALLLMGSSLSRIRLRELIRPWEIWFTSFTRLLLFPAVLLFVLPLAGLNQYQIAIPVIIMGTPVALTGGTFAAVYGGDALLANKGVILSNVLAVVTVPLVIMLLLHVV